MVLSLTIAFDLKSGKHVLINGHAVFVCPSGWGQILHLKLLHRTVPWMESGFQLVHDIFPYGNCCNGLWVEILVFP